LLSALKSDPFFELTIIAFGTHLASQFGTTINEITNDGYEVKYTVSSMLLGDDANTIASATALTALKFADFWKEHGSEFDFIFCLGDRYEMFAAVTAGIPFGLKFAHLHGGETTLGAIDDVYRHSITHASYLHFTSAEGHAEKVRALRGNGERIFVCGSLSLDNLNNIQILSNNDFLKKWNIDISRPYILITIHPETVLVSRNQEFVHEMQTVFNELVKTYQLVLTMPNADTAGGLWRSFFKEAAITHKDRVFAIENFGTQSYFTCMKNCAFLLGNTSSGIIEAASLGKFVINVGERQKGRIAGDNVMHVPFSSPAILEAVQSVKKAGSFQGVNPYYRGGAAKIIIEQLKKYKPAYAGL
jgi:GDP/UDP-N,N'-diacetylbacillosamine 2-epimerase (hydrolysing)